MYVYYNIVDGDVWVSNHLSKNVTLDSFFFCFGHVLHYIYMLINLQKKNMKFDFGNSSCWFVGWWRVVTFGFGVNMYVYLFVIIIIMSSHGCCFDVHKMRCNGVEAFFETWFLTFLRSRSYKIHNGCCFDVHEMEYLIVKVLKLYKNNFKRFDFKDLLILKAKVARSFSNDLFDRCFFGHMCDFFNFHRNSLLLENPIFHLYILWKQQVWLGSFFSRIGCCLTKTFDLSGEWVSVLTRKIYKRVLLRKMNNLSVY